MNADEINDTLDRLSRADAAEWLESGKATRHVRRLAIAYDVAQLAIDKQEQEIARLTQRAECHATKECPVCVEREENDLTATDGFEIVIDDSLPRYAYADGTDEECTYHERIEYAGEELRELRSKVAALESELDDLRAVARKAG